jgi:colanic acid biosynthesis protein WcaH
MSEFPIVGWLPAERYRAAMEDLPIVTVDVLFLNPEKTKLLLGKRVNEPYAGEFYSFGGRMYKNESFLQSALRIAKEEIGVSLDPSALTYVSAINEINDTSIFKGANYHAVDIYFYCVIENASIALDQQHSETRWFDLDDTTIHPNVKTRIEGLRKIF